MHFCFQSGSYGIDTSEIRFRYNRFSCLYLQSMFLNKCLKHKRTGFVSFQSFPLFDTPRPNLIVNESKSCCQGQVS